MAVARTGKGSFAGLRDKQSECRPTSRAGLFIGTLGAHQAPLLLHFGDYLQLRVSLYQSFLSTQLSPLGGTDADRGQTEVVLANAHNGCRTGQPAHPQHN